MILKGAVARSADA